METDRITSGYDAEIQLGAGWFHRAIEVLIENDALDTGGIPVVIHAVAVVIDPDWDLAIEAEVAGLSLVVRVRADLSDDARQLTLTTDSAFIPPTVVPFGALQGLAEPPVKVVLEGDSDHQNAVAFLANLDIHAEPQSVDPLPDDEVFARGDVGAAQSFLATDQDIAFGLGSETIQRFANDIWHTTLRADDGSHPLPDDENEKGSWSRVTGHTAADGVMQFVLEGDIPVDSPLIDVVPDPHVEITLTLRAAITGGALTFEIDTATDVDTGLLGNLFGGLVGGAAGAIVGLIIGVFTGGLLIGFLVGAGVGFVVGVIAIEVAEYVVEGIVQREINASIDGQPIREVLCCGDGVVQLARPSPADDRFNLAVLDSLPSSISVHRAHPEDELLYRQNLLVNAVYDDLTVDAGGFVVGGGTATVEVFEPEVVTIASFDYAATGELDAITYQRGDGQTQAVPIAEVFGRIADRPIEPPFALVDEPEDAELHLPAGKLATVCLSPTRIRRRDTVIQEFEFGNGARLGVADAVALQDAGVIVLPGYQLLHPSNANPYFRAYADASTANNLEMLPTFT
ncbi:DUF3892 domain-containing protein [Ilumatobacter nonamiensis]|uniref:DUF3892 domain-containing protein n=1 Tax=Ilumatobacter nonamiensis TaxID=467093 RepID=UPI000349BDBE|nr:DUF3892 domain-containing protein [Ilumatobacter nonamiensis]